MREKEQSDVYIFVKAGITFLVFMVLCIAVFFIYVEKDVENNIQNTIENHVERQSYHLKSVIDTHYGYMEAIARFIGSQDEITGENAMEIVRYLMKTVVLRGWPSLMSMEMPLMTTVLKKW